MRLEIRDIESAMVYDIGPDGAVLGRERARTDISLRDESISKRHARIFAQDGTWFLEDLNSSNGTYVDDQRITVPIRLAQGRVFSLAQRKFEVVYVESVAVSPASAPHATNGASAVGGFGPPAGLGYDETGAQSASHPEASGGLIGDGFQFEEANEAEAKGIGYFFVAVPKAIGFYLLQVPLMAFNPIGRINRSFAEQPLPVMGNLEIAAYAIPAAFFTTLIAAVFAFLATAVSGVVSVAGFVAALPMACIAAAVAGVIGFISHPVLAALINLFQGESTPKSRTNYLIHLYVLAILAAVPNGMTALLPAVPVPHVHLLAPVLAMLVVAVSLYFTIQWLRTFQVIKPAQYLVLLLGAVGVVLTAIGLVNGVIDAVDGRGPSATIASAASAVDRSSPAAGSEELQTASLAKAVRLKGAAATSEDDEAPEPADDTPLPEPTSAEDVSAKPGEQQEETAAPRPPPAVANGERAILAKIPEDKYPLGVTPFAVFLSKRDAIERAVDADPALVSRRGIRRDYERLWRVTYEVRDKYYRKRGPRWRKDKIYQRQKGQEIFERTQKYVDRLYRKLIQNKASNR